MKRGQAWARSSSTRLLGLALLVLTLSLAGWQAVSARPGRARDMPAGATAAISGRVIDAGGPVAGATVRVQATANSTVTGADGTFVLGGPAEGVPVTVSAWKEGYYCAKVENVVAPAADVTLTLRLYQTDDNPGYAWISPAGENSCASCKPAVTRIWLDNDLHAGSGSSPRFLSLYNGTDITGTVAVAPGYKRDFPGTAGNCATCHAPGAALDAPFATDMNLLEGVDRDYGVHCDFCHKVAGIYLDPAAGLPYPNTPGVLSMDVRRPFPGSEPGIPWVQLFFGSFDDDNVPEEDTYLPAITKSQWCAPCHQFSFWGTPIYQSFREWLESPYAGEGIECQACHMPADGVTTNVAPGFGGVERDPQTIHAHTMPGAASEALLQNTVTLTLTVQPAAGILSATVTLANVGAGHHVPTDHPGRHLILTVSATGDQQQPLPQVAGSAVPDWGGAQAGRPGKAYAKVLRDAATGAEPVVSYWRQALIAGDNRLPAFGRDTSTYAFAVPAAGGTVTVRAELRFRRLFQEEQDARGWNVPDVVMEVAEVRLPLRPLWRIYLPLAARGQMGRQARRFLPN